jgi:hypothetical protein
MNYTYELHYELPQYVSNYSAYLSGSIFTMYLASLDTNSSLLGLQVNVGSVIPAICVQQRPTRL